MGNDASKVHRDKHIRDVYKLKEKIGQGSYATVRRATRLKDDETVAVKVVKKARLTDEEEKRGLKEEVKLLLQVSHPQIVKLYEVYESKKNVYLIMELLNGGEMFDRIVEEQNFSEAIAAYTIVQILDALIYCHDRGICHRDLKPENLFYHSKAKDSKLVIGDFGLAKNCGDNLMKTCCGTPQYVAPEVLAMKPYDTKVDCWSLGVILYILLCGYAPFAAENHPALYEKIKKAKVVFDPRDWKNISKEARDLVVKLLHRDPKKRYSAKQAKAHPWLKLASKYTKKLGSAYNDRLKRFQARKRLKAGIATALAVCRMVDILNDIIKEADDDDEKDAAESAVPAGGKAEELSIE